MQNNTTVKEMANAWKCSQQNIRELHKNSHHKFVIIAVGSRNAIKEKKGKIMIIGKDLALPKGVSVGECSDGYHTFDELYEFRLVYNVALFNAWAETGLYDVHKSERHYEGDDCFGGGWFIVVAILPTGQISNHYPMKDWGKFKVPSCERAKYEFDGHSSKDVVERLNNLAK